MNNLAMTYEQTGGRDDEALEAWQRVLAMARQYRIEKYVERATRRMEGIQARSAGAPGSEIPTESRPQ